jgi:hypothetical protein
VIRVATWILVALVFAAGLVFNTDALLVLAGGLLWHHAMVVGLTALVLVGAAIGWRRRPWQGKRRRQATPKRRAAGTPRKPRANGSRKRAATRGAKRA